MATRIEEITTIITRELPGLITTHPELRYALTGVLAETFARKNELREILQEIRDLRADSNARFAEHSRRMEEFAQRQEEHSRQIAALREDFNIRFEEHSRRMEEFARRLDRHSTELRSSIGALGARWGLMSEQTFRNGMAGILGQEFGLQVTHFQAYDRVGEVFGQPDQVEIDVAIHDGVVILIEIKSSMSKADVYLFQRKAAFYERERGVQVKRKVILSPFLDPGAPEVAARLGMEVYTSGYDFRLLNEA